MNKTKEAINFLLEHCSGKGPIQLNNSGGKDSITIVDLFKKTKLPYVMVHSQTGIDPPEVVQFIKKHYPECKFMKPTQPFLLAIKGNNPPLRDARWCCRLLKKKPGDRLKIKHNVEGIRKEESNSRAKYPRINYFAKRDKTSYYPILDWSEQDVWDYIKKNNLPYPSLYDEGLSRIGCVVCIYHSWSGGKGHDFYRKRWPGYFKAFEYQVTKWWWHRKNSGRDMNNDCPEDFINDWYEGKASWYKGKKKIKRDWSTNKSA